MNTKHEQDAPGAGIQAFESEDAALSASSFSQSDALKLFCISQDEVEELSVTREAAVTHVHVKLKRVPLPCPDCGEMTSKIKDYSHRTITHSILTTGDCRIEYEQRRYVCAVCGRTFVEPNPFAHPGKKISTVTVYNVLRDLRDCHQTFSAVAKRYHISPTTAEKVFDEHVNIPRQKLTPYMAVDETYAFSSAQGDYVFVMMDFATLDVIDVLPSRKKADLEAYFQKIPIEEREQVKMVASDMWDTYRQITKRYLPNAKHCVDRFHLLRELSKCVTKVRIRVMKRYAPSGRKKEKPKDPAETEKEETRRKNYYLLKSFEWLLFKRPSSGKLDPNREKKYNKALGQYANYFDIYMMILDIDSELTEAVALQEEFYSFMRKRDARAAAEALKGLIHEFLGSSVAEMNSFGDTLVRWKPSIINSFIPVEPEKQLPAVRDDAPPAEKALIAKYIDACRNAEMKHMNSSVIENRNKLIKDIKHCSCGYSNWFRFRNRVLYCLSSSTTAFMDPQPVAEYRINEGNSRKETEK